VHTLFRIDQPLPVPAGQSPFHIRGLYYERLIAHIKRRVGSLNGVLELMDDPGARAFAQQRFSWTGWFDILPAMPICEAFARLRGFEFEAGVREQTRSGALEVIPSALRFALRIPGPIAMPAQTAQVVAALMDFVEMRFEETTATRSHGWQKGIPLYVAPLLTNTTIGFFRALLELRGAGDVRAKYTDVVRDINRFGFETVAIRYEFDWVNR
jgi:hypothetical protein